jgi:hypothetical protein
MEEGDKSVCGIKQTSGQAMNTVGVAASIADAYTYIRLYTYIALCPTYAVYNATYT